MDREVLQAAAEAAERFAMREVLPMVGCEGRDGDLGRLSEVLGRAAAAGLAPDGEGEGGVWAAAAEGGDAALPLAVLRQLGRGCAGVAACIHAAGLGAAEGSGRRASVALLEGWPPTWEDLGTPPPDACRIAEGLRLSGEKRFVAMPPGTDAFVVYAARDGAWRRVLVPRDAAGLEIGDVGQRTGLAALPLVDLVFDGVALSEEQVLADRDPMELLSRDLLGLSAVALGNAEGALDAARTYAASRHQGGGAIQGHAAVMALLGDAATRIEASRGHLHDAAEAAGSARRRLWRAAAAKLRVTGSAFRAVSSALQVLGGYGYMEDYRLEKRLRDAMTLRVMAVSKDAARRLCAVPCP